MSTLDEQVRAKDYSAIRAAEGLGSVAFGLLAPLLSHADEGVRELALRCAARVARPVHVPLLLERVRLEPDPALRLIAAQALGGRVDSGGARALLEVAVTDPEASVRVELVLAAEPHAASVEAGVWARAAEADPDPVTAALLRVCAARAGDAASAELLPGALAALDPGALGGLLRRPGCLEQPWGWPALRRLLRDERDAIWIYTELAPDGPPARRVCDLAADRLRAGLLGVGRAAPPGATVYTGAILDELLRAR